MKRRSVYLVPSLALLSACASIDTGQIDYRIAEPVPIPTVQRLEIWKDNCSPAGERPAPCGPLSDSRLVRKYAPTGNAFRPDEVYSIDILQGNIGSDISEAIWSNALGTSAEILILANVFEFGKSDSEAQDRRFLETSELREDVLADKTDLKVVYFGENVKAGQTFNFSNLPLQAKQIWQGNPIGIQMIVVEVDTRSQPVESMLTTLAEFGEKSNTVPLGPQVDDILFGLGKSLLDGQSKDDIIFEYRLVLHPADTVSPTYSPTFEPGKYVLRKEDVRDRDMLWRNLSFDYNTGRLYFTDKSGDQQEFRDDLYLTLDIKRYPKGTQVAVYDHMNFREFRETWESAVESDQQVGSDFAERMNDLLIERRSERMQAQLLALWADADGSMDIYAEATARPADERSCKLLPTEDTTGIRNAADLTIERAFVAFHSGFKLAMSDSNATETINGQQGSTSENGTSVPRMSEQDRLAVVGELADRMVLASSFAVQDFVTLESFQDKYIVNGPQSLLALAKSAANHPNNLMGCDYLIAKGLAKRLAKPAGES